MLKRVSRMALLATTTAMGLGLAVWTASSFSPAAKAQDARPGAAQAASQTASPATPVDTRSPLVIRGEYLARAADCAACHTAMGGKAYTGGRPFKLPFGTMYSSNLTPDGDTGIGGYSDDAFVRAVRQGVRKDGAHLYPSMPYTSYAGMTRDDALAIKAYLFSLPAAHAPTPANHLWFPFNQRWGMALWNLVFAHGHEFQADPGLSAQQNRGKYLATALGHCAECHSPRNLAYAVNTDKQFAGAVVEGWRAYNITPDKRFGVGAWSDQSLADYLSTGHAEGHGAASGAMGEAVEDSLQYLTPQDTSALVAYLRTVKPQSGAGDTEVIAAPPTLTASSAWAPGAMETADGLGRHIFESACASCHQWNGKGQQTSYAALAGSQAVSDPAGLNLTQVLLQGAKLHTGKEAVFMPAFGRAYSDVELAAVSNYVIAHFGGKRGQVTPADVKKRRAS
jgi:mono/diheme cytochrome c family protein